MPPMKNRRQPQNLTGATTIEILDGGHDRIGISEFTSDSEFIELAYEYRIACMGPEAAFACVPVEVMLDTSVDEDFTCSPLMK